MVFPIFPFAIRGKLFIYQPDLLGHRRLSALNILPVFENVIRPIVLNHFDVRKSAIGSDAILAISLSGGGSSLTNSRITAL